MFVIGRSPAGRASLMHELDTRARDELQRTLCGRPVYGGSRAYLREAISEVLCMQCIKSRARRDREAAQR